MLRARAFALFLLMALACGRSDLFGQAPPGPGGGAAARDAGLDGGPGSGGDAGLPLDAGAPSDAGRPPFRCDNDGGFGSVVGRSPLGTVDAGFVWLGLEPFGSHSCPHVTLHAAASASEAESESVTVEVLFSATAQIPGSFDGTVVHRRGTASATGPARVTITRLDGLRSTTMPWDQRAATLSFIAGDGGWTLSGAVADLPVCVYGTWMCL